MNKFYFLKLSLFIVAMTGFAFNVTFLHAQHLFSVSYNELSKENVIQLTSQIAHPDITTLSLIKNNEDKSVYPVAFSSAQHAKIIILNEETGNNVVITPADESPGEFQLAPFFIEELRQGVLGNANRYVILETTNDFSVNNIAAVSATKGDVYVPQYFYGKKENVKEALPKERQIIHIFKQKPKYFPAFPDDPENLRYVEQLEEEMSYYIYMYKLPDGTLCTYDEHFNPDNNESESRTGSNLEFILSGSLSETQRTATEYALDLWSEQLLGTVPVDINVTFKAMGSGILGGSYRQQDFLNTGQVPGCPENTYYCSALWNQLVGYDATSMRDIRIEMSTNFSFYFGLDGNTSGYDYVTIMIHEATHGLGFYPLCGSSGAYSYTTSSGGSASTNYPNIYDRQLFQGLDGVCLAELNQTQRGSLVKSNNLYSGAPGSHLLAANDSVRVKMFAPTSWMNGSSVSHWDQSVSNFQTFMKYAYAYPLHIFNTRKIGMMLDLGWTAPNSMVPVIEIIDVPDTAFVGMPLILTGTVVPEDATNQTISWSIDSVITTEAILTGDTLYITEAGIVVVTATIVNGIAKGTDYVKEFTITVTKTPQFAPDAPTLAEKTARSITLDIMEDCEFRMDAGEWQTSPVFDSLSPVTTYTFVARKAETVTHFASPESPEVQFITELNIGINENEFSKIRVYSYHNTIYIKMVETLRATALQAEITDMTGRIIYQGAITNPETAITLQVATGIYTVRLISPEGNAVATKVSISN